MFLFFLLRIIKPYTKSKYGYTGTDTVQAQECDNLIVLEQIPKPTVRYINESGWTSRKIQLEEYGWPDHMKTAPDDLLDAETNKINEVYGQAYENFPLNQLFAHPAGVKQFGGDQKMVDKLI